MIRRLLRVSRSVVIGIAAAMLTVALTSPPAALADDRLDFTATTLSGAPFNGASLQGKPAVLWFWTPWCPFCNAEAPSVSSVAAANPEVIVRRRRGPLRRRGHAGLRVQVQPELPDHQ